MDEKTTKRQPVFKNSFAALRDLFVNLPRIEIKDEIEDLNDLKDLSSDEIDTINDIRKVEAQLHKKMAGSKKGLQNKIEYSKAKTEILKSQKIEQIKEVEDEKTR